MNMIEFNKLSKVFGDRVVWISDEYGFCFSMNDDLINDVDESSKFEDLCEGVDGVECSVGYGDDIINVVSVKKLSDLDKVEGLEEFVLEYVGSNCYSEE